MLADSACHVLVCVPCAAAAPPASLTRAIPSRTGCCLATSTPHTPVSRRWSGASPTASACGVSTGASQPRPQSAFPAGLSAPTSWKRPPGPRPPHARLARAQAHPGRLRRVRERGRPDGVLARAF